MSQPDAEEHGPAQPTLEAIKEMVISSYTESYDDSVHVKCCVCSDWETKTWGRLLYHFQKSHSIPQKALKGTVLYEKGRQCINAADRQKRLQPQVPKQASKANTNKKSKPMLKVEDGGDTGGGDDDTMTGSQHSESIANETIQLIPDGTIRHREDGSIWLEPDGSFWKNCYVRVLPTGKIYEPLHIIPIHTSDIQPGVNMGSNIGNTSTCATATESISSQGHVTTKDTGTNGSSQDTVDPNTSTSNWSSSLPTLKIKQTYKDAVCPKPSSHGGRTGNFPIKMKSRKLCIPSFERWVKTETKQDKSAMGDTMRGVTRFFDMLETDTGDIEDPSLVLDPATLVSFFANGTCEEMFDLPILSPQYGWTKKLKPALLLFCEWHLSVLDKKKLLSDDTCLPKYSAALEGLKRMLKGGITKKVNADNKKRIAQRRSGDAVKLSNFMSIDVMKEAIFKAMVCLHYIFVTYTNVEALPAAVQSAANAALVGILYLNGFAGRKMEWEVLLASYILEQFANGLDYIVCDQHKTAYIYGSLAKWLAPGTIEAIKVYLKLPRRSDILSFLVPCFATTARADIAKHLQHFGKTYLPTAPVWPTVNLLRKWYHTVLCKMARAEEHVLKMFEVIDAHRPHTARKHYVLQTPADDAALAKALVHAMIKEPVPWPTHLELENEGAKNMALKHIEVASEMQMPVADQEGDNCSEESDSDDLGLEYCEGFEGFGIMSNHAVLMGASDDAMPIPLMDLAASCIESVGTMAASGDGNNEQCQLVEASTKQDQRGHINYNKEQQRFEYIGRGPTVLIHEDEPVKKQLKLSEPRGSLSSSSSTIGPNMVINQEAKHTKGNKAKPAKDADMNKKTKKQKKEHKGQKIKKEPLEVFHSQRRSRIPPEMRKWINKKTKKQKKEHKGQKIKKEPLEVFHSQRRSRIPPEMRKWIEDQHSDHKAETGDDPFQPASTAWFEKKLLEGRREKVFNEFVTESGLRSHIRRHLCAMLATTAEDVE